VAEHPNVPAIAKVLQGLRAVLDTPRAVELTLNVHQQEQICVRRTIQQQHFLTKNANAMMESFVMKTNRTAAGILRVSAHRKEAAHQGRKDSALEHLLVVNLEPHGR